MRICIVGSGYVGLTAAVAFAKLGHRVTGVDTDLEKIDMLEAGKAPFYEPGLGELLTENVAAGSLRFSSSMREGLREADLVFIAVGTPQGPDGRAELTALESAVDDLAAAGRSPCPVVIKSTVPVGTGDRLEARLRDRTGLPWNVVSNPEFLREGSAINDFLHPDRVIVGTPCTRVAKQLAALYADIEAPLLVTDRRTAELVKYASNAFLATKISFINEIGDLCERLGIDVTEVSQGMGLDHRIGPHFLHAGLGYGGSCFPKDVAALQREFLFQGLYPAILTAVPVVNTARRGRFLDLVRYKLGSLHGRTLAVWGLSFKANTDDMRAAPALDILPALMAEGARLHVHDPVAGSRADIHFPGVIVAETPLEAATGAEAVLILTDWPQFTDIDLIKLKECMARPVLVDGRNQLDWRQCRKLRFEYCSLGRPSVGQSA